MSWLPLLGHPPPPPPLWACSVVYLALLTTRLTIIKLHIRHAIATEHLCLLSWYMHSMLY